MSSQSEEVKRLLASLAQSSSSTQPIDRPLHQAHASSQVSVDALDSSIPGLGGLIPERSAPSSFYERPTRSPEPSTLGVKRSFGETGDLHLSRQHTLTPDNTRQKPNLASKPDASSITEWPSAIRYVMQHLAPDPLFAAKIRRLIASQHTYEKDWWDKRQEIMARHASRDTSSAQLTDIFASLGVVVPTGTASGRDYESERRELSDYDMKVYKQLLAMSGDFDRQLRGLNVPFYAIRHELVILEEGREKQSAIKGRIDKGELRELQKKMLDWLELSFPAGDGQGVEYRA
jgi:hypothetical protein